MNRLLALFALLAALPLFAEDKPLESFGPTDDVNGVRVLHVGGSPRAIGKKIGKNFRDEIQYLFREYFETYTEDPELRDRFISSAHKLEKYMSADEKAELEALAEGCELPYEKVLVVHTFLDSIRTVNCSTFVLKPPATTEGQVIFGRNLDFPGRGVAHKHAVVIVYEPKDRFAFASITWPGLNGVLSGMNEHGLCLAVMNVYNKEDSLKGVPYVLLFRRVLETCRTFDEAVDFITDAPRTCGNNLMVVDAKGRCGTLEIDHDSCKVRRPKDGAIIATNHHRLGKPDPSWTCPRWFRLNQLEKTWHGKIGMSEAKKMLQSVPQGDLTLQAMIFLPTEKRLFLATGSLPATKGKFREVEGMFDGAAK